MPQQAEGAVGAGRDPAVAEGAAFGLSVASALPVPGVTRQAELPTRSVELVWPPEAQTPGGDERFERVWAYGHADDPGLTIDRLESSAYRVRAPGHGEYVIAADGLTVQCAPAEGQWPWRLVFAQVLPIVAAVQGLEALHAGAVGVDGAAWGILGASGAGKTTLTLELVRQGAAFLADDVLTIESAPSGLTAHPGAGIVNVDDPQAAAGLPGARTLATSDKAHVEVQQAGSPMPFRRLYVIEWSEGADLTIDRVWPPDPRTLLGSTFVFVVSGAERLIHQLEIHAAIAEQVPMYRLRPPRDWSPQRIADAVLGHEGGDAS